MAVDRRGGCSPVNSWARKLGHQVLVNKMQEPRGKRPEEARRGKKRQEARGKRPLARGGKRQEEARGRGGKKRQEEATKGNKRLEKTRGNRQEARVKKQEARS